MGAFGIVGGGLGIIGGISANVQRSKQADSDLEDIKAKRDSYLRKLSSTSSILRGSLEIDALSATAKSKQSAIEAFRDISAGESAVSKSGAIGGTPVFMLEKAIADSANALSDQWSMMSRRLAMSALQGSDQIADLRDSVNILSKQVQTAQETSDYYSSPLAYMMSALTGALSGAAAGNNIETVKTKVSGAGENPSTFDGSARDADAADDPLHEGVESLWKSPVTYYSGDHSAGTLQFNGVTDEGNLVDASGKLLTLNPLDIKGKAYSGFKTFNFEM